ncbi:MAG: hypothetical protein NW241_22305 [Bacteroidia bacterium]|nr:hypothetical protein [Bacteroidia bacterium]
MTKGRPAALDSDSAFLSVYSWVLILAGGSAAAVLGACRLGWVAACGWRWMPASGGLELFTPSGSLNFPLAMLALGIGLRIRNGMGWVMSMLLAASQAGIWLYLAGWLAVYGQASGWQGGPGAEDPGSLLPGAVADLCLGLIMALLALYLGLRSTRSLFFDMPADSIRKL